MTCRAAVCVAAVFIMGAVSPACSSKVPPRAQLLLFVDTDAPVAEMLLEQRELADAAVDTLRIDVLGDDGEDCADEPRILPLPAAADWPVSFGVAVPGGARSGAAVQLRLRAFRSTLGRTAASCGADRLEPSPNAAIDRRVTVAYPAEGVSAVTVTLAGDCFGVPLGARTTCVDAARTSVGFDEGVRPLASTARPLSRAGTWSKASAKGCIRVAPPGAVCVRGGVTILGDTRLDGLDAVGRRVGDRLRPVALSSFFLDAHELTVGRYKALVADGRVGLRAPLAAPGLEDCAPELSGDAALPIACVTFREASGACAALGGHLPSEAQWEHAARGRGRHWLFPWGDRAASCCASHARARPGGALGSCQGSGPAKVGSFAAAPSCDGLGDVTPDGVADLAGNVQEWTETRYVRYDDACWGVGPSLDPRCVAPSLQGAFVVRGGSWSDLVDDLAASFRRFASPERAQDTVGFRCAYRDGAP